jgi:hypothetical protein
MATSKRDREQKYGMDPGDIEWLEGANEGRCWICKEVNGARSLAVDHDHATGAVRGLLCNRCNQLLGLARDNIEILAKAGEYLKASRKAFADVCHGCAEQWQTLGSPEGDPDGLLEGVPYDHVVESDGSWTVFGYRCDRGHAWTCGWRTFGTPFTWKL